LTNDTKKQALRYLAAGVWNTVFGYAVYAAFTALLTGKIPFAYMAAAVLSNVVAVTQAFFIYKKTVFKTKGNVLKEYLKCWMVYGAGVGLNLILLPILVAFFKTFLTVKAAPYAAGAATTAVIVFFSFFGHKKLTFRQ